MGQDRDSPPAFLLRLQPALAFSHWPISFVLCAIWFFDSSILPIVLFFPTHHPPNLKARQMVYCKYGPNIKNLAAQMASEQKSYNQINQTLRRSISCWSFSRWTDLYQRRGNANRDTAEYDRLGRPHMLCDNHLALLHDIVVHEPDLYLDELQVKMNDLTGLNISKATIQQDLSDRLGLSLLVNRRVNSNQSAENRADFIQKVAGIPPEFLVCSIFEVFNLYCTVLLQACPKNTQAKPAQYSWLKKTKLCVQACSFFWNFNNDSYFSFLSEKI